MTVRHRPIVILTGAGISAESGIATFRGADGLWEGHRIEDVASPGGFRRDPATVHRFYNARRAQLVRGGVMPNAAHLAVAELARRWPAPVRVITQNVDDLHERAGMAAVDPDTAERVGDGWGEVLHMHGELRKVRHVRTGEVQPWDEDLNVETIDPVTGDRGVLRPHIVWFGEAILGADLIDEWLCDCELFLSIGTQGAVWPAAGFVQVAREQGRARAIEFNLHRTEISDAFDATVLGKAGETLPGWVARMLDEVDRDPSRTAAPSSVAETSGPNA